MKRIALYMLVAGLLGVTLFAADPVSRRDAARLQAKLDRIAKGSPTGGKTVATTPITETEINSYLQYELADRTFHPVSRSRGCRFSKRDGCRAGPLSTSPVLGRAASRAACWTPSIS